MAEIAGLLLAIAGGVDVAVRTSYAITELVHEWKMHQYKSSLSMRKFKVPAKSRCSCRASVIS